MNLRKVGTSAVAWAALLVLAAASATPAAAAPTRQSIAADGQITIAEVRNATTDDLVQALKELSGARDVTITGGKTALLEALESAGVGHVLVPERVLTSSLGSAARANEPASASAVTPSVVINDASITYQRRTGGASSLLVCHNWGTTGCGSGTGWLGSGQNSASTFGWSDTDGYLHPSSSCKTRATATFFLQVSYSFYDYGWIKVSGLYGGAWVVEMWC